MRGRHGWKIHTQRSTLVLPVTRCVTLAKPEVTMRLHRFMLIAVGAFVLVAGAPTAQAKSVTPITTCGQTVTTSAVLTQDLDCTGVGVFVGASGITIDLKGFTLRGDLFHSGINYGIDDLGGFDAVTVKNGVIVNFFTGIVADGDADNVSVSGVVVSGNDNNGIQIVGDFAKIQSVTVAGNSGGVGIAGDAASIKSLDASGNAGWALQISGDSASVKATTTSGNGVIGVFVTGGSASIQAVTASGNGAHGIYVAGDAAVLKGNTTNGNGSPDGDSNEVGLGIDVVGYTTPPVGTKNTALGNDDPSECSPAALC